jgi:hypothetical protein
LRNTPFTQRYSVTATDAAIAIQEGMNGLELDVEKAGFYLSKMDFT